MAHSFAQEMGGIAQAFGAYSDKWTSSAIKANTAAFNGETAKVMSVLLQRIQRENTGLYAMVDRLVA
jgi:hypothetical protein